MHTCQQQKQTDHKDQRSNGIVVAPTHHSSTTKSDRKINLYISENQSDSNRSSKDCLDKDNNAATVATISADNTQRLLSCCNGGIETKTTPLSQDNTKKLSNSNDCNNTENVYEKLSNFKCCPIKSNIRIIENKADLIGGGCKECELEYPLVDISVPVNNQQSVTTPITIANKSSVKKFIRKSRSKKQKSTIHYTTADSCEPMPRVRSLSVGNENCYRSRNNSKANGGDDCLNNLRRNDLIDIIRESMEKNRLCFQPNGYVYQYFLILSFANLKQKLIVFFYFLLIFLEKPQSVQHDIVIDHTQFPK